MKYRALLAMGAAVLLVVSCGGFRSRQPGAQIYTLEPTLPAAAEAAPPPATSTLPSTLLIVRPLAAPGLDSDRIALTRDAQRLDYYALSRWPAPLPDFLRSLTIDALRAAGKFRAVQSDAAAFAADQVLRIEIRRFQAEYRGGGPPTVHVQLVAALGRRSDRSLMAEISVESSAAAAENRMESVIAAFQAAAGEALGQLASRLPP